MSADMLPGCATPPPAPYTSANTSAIATPTASAPAAQPSPAQHAAPSGGPAPAASPLAQRQWRREAQRSQRLALTAVKDAVDRFAAGSKAAYKVATDLTNSILLGAYLGDMPLGALAEVPGLKAQAAAKLFATQARLLRQLDSHVAALAAIVDDMMAAADSVQAQLQPEGCGPYLPTAAATARSGSAVDSSSVAADSDDRGAATTPGAAAPPAWQAAAPLFASMPLPAAVAVLREVAAQHGAEAATKRRLADSLAGIAAAARGEFLDPLMACGRAAPRNGAPGSAAGAPGAAGTAAGPAFGAGGAAGAAAGGAPGLSQSLTVHLAAWLLAPELDGALVEQRLAVLTDEMAGF